MGHMPKTLGVITLVAAAGLALTGCTKSTTSPAADAQTTASASTVATTANSAAAQWDPCSIPESALSGVGLDPSTKDSTVAGAKFPGWKVCSWESVDKKYDLTILTSGNNLDDYRKRTDFQEFTPTTVGSHQALQYREVGENHDLACSITVQLSGGTVDFGVLNRYGTPDLDAPCPIVRQLADGLAQYLPNA